MAIYEDIIRLTLDAQAARTDLANITSQLTETQRQVEALSRRAWPIRITDQASTPLQAISKVADGLVGKPLQMVVTVIDHASSVLAGIGEAANAMVSTVSGAAGAVGSVISGIGSAASGVVNTISTAATVTTGVITGMAVNLASTGLNYIDLWQRSTAAWTTILGSAEQANDMMDRLAAFSANMPFGRATWIEATQQLLGFGYAADDVVPTLQAIGDATAAIGGGAQEVQEITRILAQINATGKITAVQFNQLGLRGINAREIIAEQMGMTANDIAEGVTKGTISGSAALDALITGMQQKYQGAGQNVAQTWSGMLGGINSRLRDLGAALAEPFVSRQGGGILIEWGRAFTDLLANFNKVLAPFMTEVVSRLMPAMERVTGWLRGAADALTGFDPRGIKGVVDQLARMAPVLAPISAVLLSMGAANIKNLLPMGLGNLIPTLHPVLAAVTALLVAVPQVRGFVVDLGRALYTTFTSDAGALGVVGDLIERIFGPETANLFRPLLQRLMEFVRGFEGAGNTLTLLARHVQNMLRPALQGLGDYIRTYVLPVLADLARWIVRDVVPAAIQFAQWFGEKIVPHLRDLSIWMLTRLIPALQQLAAWVGDNIMPHLLRFGDWLATEGVAALKVFFGWLDNVGGVLEAMAGWLGTHVVPQLEKMADWLERFWSAFMAEDFAEEWENIQKIFETIGQIGQELGGILGELWTGIFGGEDALAGAAGEAGDLSEGFDDAARMGSAFRKEVRGMTSDVNDLLTAVRDVLGGLKDLLAWLNRYQLTMQGGGPAGVLPRIWDMQNEAEAAAFREYQRDQQARTQDLGFFEGAQGSPVQRLREGGLGALLTWGDKPLNEQEWTFFGKPLNAPNVQATGQDIGEAFTDGVASGITDGAAAPAAEAGTVAEDVLDGSWSLMQNRSPDVGASFDIGFASGIDRNAGLPEAASRNVGQKALDAIKSVLGIRSPSAELQDVGQSMMQGLADGITGNTSLVSSAMSQLGQTIRSQLQNMMSAIGGMGGGVLSGAASAVTGEIADYIRQAASSRGIDPNVAVRVAESEGGVTEPARRGTFATGSSWWPFQLHYGGAGTPYESLGTVAGMGNTFTQVTGFQPGDPAAWKASVDYALDEVARSGWGKWYGAAAAGIGNWQGIRDDGGWLPPGVSMVGNFTGQPERVLAPGQNTVSVNLGGLTINAPGGDIHSLRAAVPQLAEELLNYIVPQLELAVGNMVV